MYSKNKTRDLLVLIGLGLFATAASYALHATFLISAFLFFGVPSIYLWYRTKAKKKELLVATAIFGGLYCFLMDYMAELNGAWAWQDSQLVFPHRILGVVSADAIIWTMMWVFLLVLFYEHMLERDKKDRISNHVWYVVGVGLLLLAAIVYMHVTSSPRLQITHAYFVLGLMAMLPFLFVIYARPYLLPKLLKAAAYFVPLYLVYEVVGRSLGQWDFPGHYYGMIQIGSITFPIEEFSFWILLSSMVVLGGYELFIDDGK